MQSISKVRRKLCMVWNSRPHGERLSKENRVLAKQPNKWMSGMYDTGKGKGKKSKGKRKGKGKPGKGKKARTKTREWVNTTPRKERNDLTKWRGTTIRKTHKLVKHTQSGRTRVGITLTTGLTEIGGHTIGAHMCGLTLHGSKQQDTTVGTAATS